MNIAITIQAETTGSGAGDERLRREILKRVAEALEAEYGCGCAETRRREDFADSYATCLHDEAHREDEYDGAKVFKVEFL